MYEMIKAGDLKVGDKFRVEATVKAVHNYVVYANNGGDLGTDGVTLDSYFEVELIERAMPKFEPGGILRYCHDPVKFPNDTVDWFITKKNQAVQLNSIHYVARHIYSDDLNGLSVDVAPHCWTYFPPATANDNGTRLG